MTTMHGDPELERAYNQWKEGIMRVTLANPSNATTIVGNAHLTSDTMFRHLAHEGFSKARLEDMIPLEGSAMLGVKLYDKEVFIHYTGKLQFIDPNLIITPPEDVDDDTCQHGFVVSDEQDDMLFLCRECDERFPRHPDLMAKETRPVQLSEVELTGCLDSFREGFMTLDRITEKTKFSLGELKEALARLFPPKTIKRLDETLAGDISVATIVDVELARTSCPKEVDVLFQNPHVTLDDIQRVVDHADIFADVIKVESCPDLTGNNIIMKVHFVDDSIQRVEVPAKEFYTAKRLGRARPEAFTIAPTVDISVKALFGNRYGEKVK